MARLPSAADVPTVSSGVARDQGIRNTGRFADPRGTAELGQGLQVAGARLAEAQERINNRKLGAARDRAELAFLEHTSQAMTELRSGGADLADETLVQATIQGLDQQRQQLLDSVGGDEKLALRLQRRMIATTDQLGALSAAANRQQLDSSWQRRVNAIADTAGDSPGSLATAMAQLDEEMDFLEIGPAERREKRLEGMEAIGTSAISSFLAAGDPRAAEEVLDSPELTEFLPPTTRNQLRARIAQAKRAGTEATGRILSEEERAQMFPSMPAGSVVQIKEQNGVVSDAMVRFKPDAAGGASARDQKAASMAAMFRAQGMEDEKAVDMGRKLAEGAARVEINEKTGKIILIDEVRALSGHPDAVIELEIQPSGDVERVEIEPQDTLFSMAGDATGLRSAFLATTARLPFRDQGSLSEGERAALNARTTFNTFQGDAARGLVHNPRVPVGEFERIMDALDISPQLLDNEAAMQARLIAVDRFLRTREEQFLRDARDTSVPEGDREAQKANAIAMRNAIDRIGAPQKVDFSKLDVAAIEAMDVPNLRWVMQQMTAEELDALPDEVVAEMRAVMSGRR